MRLISFIIIIGLVLLATAHTGSKIVLGVLDFQNISGNPQLDYLEKALPEMLITNLMASAKLVLVERSKLNHIIEEQKLNLSGGVNEDKAIKIGNLIGADHLLYGSIFESNRQIRFDARICNTSSGNLIVAEKIELDRNADFIEAIDRLAENLLLKLTNETVNFDDKALVETFKPKEGKVLAVNCLLDGHYKLKGSNAPTYLLVNLNAGEMVKKQARVPLNICMVIDKSGSMSGENKLEYVKKAALFVVDNLEKNDYFSLVAYDTHVYPSLPSGRISQKEQLKTVIRTIETGSATNLSGGMLEGYAQVATHFEKGYVNRVLLLSDGLANTGITNPSQLQKIAADKNALGFTLSTFGVGDDFNEDLMTNLAEYGGANYYFIDSPDKIPQIFSNELQGLLSVIAQNVRLEIDLNSNIQLINVFGYPYRIENNRVTIKLNDIFSREEKSILIKIECPTVQIGKVSLADIVLTYDDVVVANRRITESFSKSIEVTDDEKLVAENTNPTVAENIALFESTRLLDEAMTQVDRRNFKEARESIATNLSFLQKNVDYRSSRRLKQQILNVMRYAEETKQAEEMKADDLRQMQKRSKFDNYLQKKKR